MTDEMKKERAEQIAKALGDNARWHSHGRGISMAVLDRDLNLQIEDLEKTPDIHGKLRAYYKLLKGYALRMGQQVVLHRHNNYLLPPGGYHARA